MYVNVALLTFTDALEESKGSCLAAFPYHISKGAFDVS